MGLSLRKKWSWNYLLLAFAFPFLGMLVVMMFSQYRPFGKYSMLYSDMYHQYYPFFVGFRRALRNGDSLLYNWSIGMGVDYLGLIAYYLSSPLNLLSVVVPEKYVLDYFSLLMPIKLGFAGLFYALFLKKTFQREDFSISVFGGMYGLCAWALAYQWNVMWLDTFALLPMVVLGTVSLIRERKFILYTLTLSLSIVANYYIGLFTCIFVALVFFCVEVCRFPGWKRFFGDLGWIALFSILAIGMTLFLSYSSVAGLQSTQSSVNKFPTDFRLNIASENTLTGLLSAMRSVAGNMGGALEPSFKEGLPNLYCGVGAILLGFLFLMSEDVKWQDRLAAFSLLIFFNLSFIIRQLDYIWHGFHFTNMIPYRFSFLYSFVLLYMAYRAWLLRRRFDVLQISAAGFLTAAVLCCSDSILSTVPLELKRMTLDIPVYFIYNASFLLLYVMVMLYASWKGRPAEEPEERYNQLRMAAIRRMYARCLFLGVVSIELIATLLCFGLYFPGTGISDYPRGREDAASMFRYLEERQEKAPFSRTEVTHSQTLNDSSLNGYDGISAFTSSANVHITEFLKALGYGAKNTYNRYCFEESSPVANLFLDLRYMMDRDGKDKVSSAFEEVHHYGKVTLLENRAWLPLGFVADRDLAEVDFAANENPFTFQNGLFSAATGKPWPVWRRATAEDLAVLDEGVKVNKNNSFGYCTYSDASSGANLIYSFKVSKSGFACVHLDLSKRNSFYVSLNGEELYREDISLPQMLAVGDVQAGDVVDIRILCGAGESGTANVSLAVMDNDLFFRGYEYLAENPMTITTFRDTLVEGTVDSARDGILYTSIPQNGNWTAQVDGEDAEIILVGDCMIAVDMPAGQHRVSFRYRNAAFALGWKVSLLCAAAFLGLVQLCYRPDWKQWANRLPKFPARKAE